MAYDFYSENNFEFTSNKELEQFCMDMYVEVFSHNINSALENEI